MPQEESVENSNCYDIKNLAEIAELEAHISFAEELISKYDWEAGARKRFLSQLELIRAKQQDKLLNLTVVGEFSTGKSTFINALLRRDEFLVSSALQGTTVATTVIEHSKRCRIDLIYHSGQTQRKRYRNVEKMKTGLIEYTSDPEIAKNLYSVKLSLPAATLAEGFRILDTPGVNVTEQWHEEVTIRTIREMADMVILIIDAGKPLTQSFCDFIRLHLSDMLNRCVFVVTRIDMVRRSERNMILSYLKDKISFELDIEEPIVLPYAALEVVNSEGAEELSALARQSLESERKMLSHMGKLKILAQTQRLMPLVNSLYTALLEKIDVGPFANAQIQQCRMAFGQKARIYRGNLVDIVERELSTAREGVMEKLNEKVFFSGLKRFAKSGLPKLCARKTEEIAFRAEEDHLSLYECFCSAIEDFQENYLKEFPKMKSLKICEKAPKKRRKDVTITPMIDFTQVAEYVSEKSDERDKIIGKYGLIGFGIGLLFMGVGAIPGIFIGMIAGAAKAPQINDVIRETEKILDESLDLYFSDAQEQILGSFDNYAQLLESQYIPDEVHRHLKTYQKKFSRKALKGKEGNVDEEMRISEIQKDIERISDKKASMEALREKLSKLSGKEA